MDAAAATHNISSFERLPNELHEMILAECLPSTLLALISACAISLRVFERDRERQMVFLNDKIRSEIPFHIFKHALNAACLGLLHRGARGPRTNKIRRTARQYLYGSHNDDENDMILTLYQSGKWDSLALLAEIFNVIDHVDNLAARYTHIMSSDPEVAAMMSYTPEIQDLMGWKADVNLAEKNDESTTDPALKIYFLRFEVCFRALFHRNREFRLLAPSRHSPLHQRHPFASKPSDFYDDYHLVLHYVFHEHKLVVRDVELDLIATQCERLCYPAPPKNETTDQLEEAFLEFSKRTFTEEDRYCLYMATFGIQRLDQLTRMSKEERRKYTLEQYSRFSQLQAQSIYHREGWKRDHKQMDRSRLLYWHWNMDEDTRKSDPGWVRRMKSVLSTSQVYPFAKWVG